MIRRFDKSQKVWFGLTFTGLISGSGIFGGLFEPSLQKVAEFFMLFAVFLIGSYFTAKYLGKLFKWEPRGKSLS